MDDCARLRCFAFGPFGFRDGGPYQLANTRDVEIRRLRDADVPDQFAFAAQQTVGIGQHGTEIKTEVHPVGMGSGEDEGVAGALCETEMAGDGVDLVDEFVGCWSFFEDQFSRGKGEFLNHFAVRCEEFEIFGIGWALAHSASL